MLSKSTFLPYFVGTLAFSRHSINMKEWIHVLWARVLPKLWNSMAIMYWCVGTRKSCFYLQSDMYAFRGKRKWVYTLYSCTHGANTVHQEAGVRFSNCLHLRGRHEVGSSINTFSSRTRQLIPCRFHLFYSSLVIQSERCFMRCDSWTEGGKRKEKKHSLEEVSLTKSFPSVIFIAEWERIYRELKSLKLISWMALLFIQGHVVQ